MPRPRRLNIAGATYHVMARGNRKSRIFVDPCDRNEFNAVLAETSSEFEVDVVCDCQMGTHYHVVLVTPRGNLSQFMRELDGRYAQFWNRRRRTVGHVFQGPFKSVIVEHDVHLINEIAYVLKNPVVGRRVSRAEDWPWSSYRATIGLEESASYLSLTWLDLLFPASSRRVAGALSRSDGERPAISVLFELQASGCRLS